jgi:hypothetical protein
VTSDNVEIIGTMPVASSAISIAFSSTSPHMYVSTHEGIEVYDLTDPHLPKLVGFEPMAIDENEAVSLGERPNGDKFVLVGSNGVILTKRGDKDTSSRFVVVVDVTNPTAPNTVATLVTPTRTHTVSCINAACDYAFSDGRAGLQNSIVDLRDWKNPVAAGVFKSVVPSGHDEDRDDKGILWHVGAEGAVALDVGDPKAPKQLASTGPQGVGSGSNEYNHFIIHNSYRPNAGAFTQTADENGKYGLNASGPAAVANGNVLLATEENYTDPTCATEGKFETWYIPYLDDAQYKRDNPTKKSGGGKMTVLDSWNTELPMSGLKTPAGAFCSAHYFDYRNGFVAQSWYQQGTRILDVRDAKNIKQVGYYFAVGQESWATYFVPPHIAKGETLLYTADVVRGIDILKVTLPTTPPGETADLTAPILKSWLAPDANLAARKSADWGFACPLPLAALA